jgi:hypothetical protein
MCHQSKTVDFVSAPVLEALLLVIVRWVRIYSIVSKKLFSYFEYSLIVRIAILPPKTSVVHLSRFIEAI